MLVLSRKENESIVIGDGVRVVVVAVRGDKVKLGIEAPPEVPVHREEVFDEVGARSLADGPVDGLASMRERVAAAIQRVKEGGDRGDD